MQITHCLLVWAEADFYEKDKKETEESTDSEKKETEEEKRDAEKQNIEQFIISKVAENEAAKE